MSPPPAARVPHSFRFSSIAFVLAVLLLSPAFASRALAAPEALPGTDDKWQHFQSPNFELYSRVRTGESRELLWNLELLRAVFIERFKLVERRRQPVTVYAFATEKDFRAYGPKEWGPKHSFEGFYLDGAERAVISLSPSRDDESARALIFHEYVHHLFRASEEDPPIWFNEGVAELFSNLVVSARTIQFGRPSAGRIFELQGKTLLPLEQLFAIDHESSVYRQNNHTGLFYAEAWVLLHYWHFGMSQLPPEKISQFLADVRRRPQLAPDALRERFQAAFGMDYPQMIRQLQQYISGGHYRWTEQPIPAIEGPETYAMRKVSRDEIRLRLAELSVRVNRGAAGKLAILTAGTATPPDVRSLELLGAEALRDSDVTMAREYWTRAIAAGSANPAVYRETGLLECRDWFQQFDYYFRPPAETTARLRELLLRSIADCPDQNTSYEMLAWVEAYAGTPDVRNVNLVQHHFGTLKEKARTLLALAFVRHRLGDDPSALDVLTAMDALNPDPWVSNGCAFLRAKIEHAPEVPLTPTGHQKTITVPIRLPKQTSGGGE